MKGIIVHKMSRIFLMALILSLVIILAACGDSGMSPSASFPDEFPIDETFLEYYKSLGGKAFLGPAISPEFTQDGIQYQYTVTSLLVFDPKLPSSQQYKLASIASAWDIEEPAEPNPVSQNVAYVNGHMIWEEVLPYFNQLGATILGEPLTGVKFNPEKNRYEQYMMNVGFYRLVDDPPGAVHLLPYGAWMCAQACNYEFHDALPNRQMVSTSDESLRQADEIFLEIAARLGFEFTGASLSESYLAGDGYFEKVFENIVLFSNPQIPTQVSLRPLPLLLGIEPDSPVSENVEVQRMYFYSTQDDLGYNVPEPFVYYITEHGTMEVSGSPITELHTLNASVVRQCFTNICLEYHVNAPAALQIRPSALGIDYLKKPDTPAVETPAAKPSGLVSVQVLERFPMVPSTQSQIIEVLIYEDHKPLKGVDFMVLLSMPNGKQITVYMPPTDDNGKSSLVLDPIDAQNGIVIPYQACVLGIFNPPVCIIENFVIWQSP
jgi:hypothetical protein